MCEPVLRAQPRRCCRSPGKQVAGTAQQTGLVTALSSQEQNLEGKKEEFVALLDSRPGRFGLLVDVLMVISDKGYFDN